MLKAQVLPGNNGTFASWQAKMNQQIAGYPGFISLEFLNPSEQDWIVVQRFGNTQQASFWQTSPIYNEIIDQLKHYAAPNTVKSQISDLSALNNGVTEVIVAEVFSEKESDYREWIAKIHLEEAKFPGFRGVYVQSPNEEKGKFWITLLQFDTIENLDRWLNSSERRALLNDSKSLISHLETHRVITPYAGWFTSIAKVGVLPPLWKQTMIVLLVLFPIVMLEMRYLVPLLKGLDISLSTFIGNAISVSLISFPMAPIAIYFLKWWLSPSQNHYRMATIAGTLTVFALYALEVWFFWSFLKV